jgi:hypothetical protein
MFVDALRCCCLLLLLFLFSLGRSYGQYFGTHPVHAKPSSFVLSSCGNCPFQTKFHTRSTRLFIINLRANDPQAQWPINNNRQIESQMGTSHHRHFFFSQSTITSLPIFYYFQISNIANQVRISHESYPCYRSTRMSYLCRDLIGLRPFLRSLNKPINTSARETRGI